MLTLTITVLDTASLDIFVDKKLRTDPLSTWTVILTDSLINTGATSNSGKTLEYALRAQGVEKSNCIDCVYRTRTAFRASGNGVTSATYTESWNWR